MKITLTMAEFNKMKDIISKKNANYSKKNDITMHDLKKLGITTSLGFGNVSLNISEEMSVAVLKFLTDKSSTELKTMVSNTMKNNTFLDTVMSILVGAKLRLIKGK